MDREISTGRYLKSPAPLGVSFFDFGESLLKTVWLASLYGFRLYYDYKDRRFIVSSPDEPLVFEGSSPFKAIDRNSP